MENLLLNCVYELCILLVLLTISYNVLHLRLLWIWVVIIWKLDPYASDPTLCITRINSYTLFTLFSSFICENPITIINLSMSSVVDWHHKDWFRGVIRTILVLKIYYMLEFADTELEKTSIAHRKPFKLSDI
jgi:hypothetical protein